MKHFLLVSGLFAALGGCLLLLPLLAWASLQDPGLTGANYLAAVAGKLLTGRAAWFTLAGVSAIALGLAAALHTAFLAGPDESERRAALPAFWAALAAGTLAAFALLLCVNYFGLQAGEVRTISRRAGR